MRLRLLTVLATALAAVGVTAPQATASHATVRCRLEAVSNDLATGPDTWEGVMVGYIIGNAGESVSVRCVVKVNGAVRSASAWGSSTTSATTLDRGTFVRTLTEVAQLCAQYTTAHGSGETCFATTTTQVPPPEVVDFADAVIDATDVFTCAVLANLAGRYLVAEIEWDGDTYVNGELVWDCPPFEPGGGGGVYDYATVYVMTGGI